VNRHEKNVWTGIVAVGTVTTIVVLALCCGLAGIIG
jgi:hypothetical protein